jgi:hypothetical protein
MVKVKDQYLATVIAFGKSGQALSKRSQDELQDLAIMALRSNNPSLLRLFEEPLPSLEELLKSKMAKTLPKIQAVPSDEAANITSLDGGNDNALKIETDDSNENKPAKEAASSAAKENNKAGFKQRSNRRQ